MDREIRILHTADTHLGYKQYHSEVRRKDFFEAFEIVIKDAVEMKVDAVVHAGDFFDSRNPTLEDLLEAINILSRLKAAGIPFFGIVGNHESKQNTQWLDLLQEMRLAARLGKKPQLIEDVVVYGIDSVPRSKIPLFDYSGFEAPDASPLENCRTLLVMHQIVQPFPYAEWDCTEVLEKFPFKVDVILLGDYHKYEKFKLGETWVTYPGSTERNSTSEEEPRSYNIITLSDEGVEISKRTIPTRYFLPIPVTLNGEEKPYEQIFSAVNEHLEELPESMVLLEIFGDSGAVLSLSEIEEYLLKKGALVPRVKDQRIKESIFYEALKVTFSDPDHAVANEIKQMSLNDGGLIIDEIVRNPNVPRSRVDEETEGRLSKLIEVIDFKDPDFRIRIPASSVRNIEPEEARPDNEDKLNPDIKPAVKKEFIRKTESRVNAGSPEISWISDRIKNPDIKIPEPSTAGLDSSSPEPAPIFGPEAESAFESKPEPILEPETKPVSNPAPGPISKTAPGPEFKHISEHLMVSASKPTSELASEPAANKLAILPETLKVPEKSPGKKIKPLKRDESRSKKDNEPEKDVEPKKDNESETNNEQKKDVKPEKDAVRLPELRIEASPEKEEGGKTEELAQGKPVKASDTDTKTAKKGQKSGKGKSPAAPRQYNLGDYL
jgi:exonuclease SbcD